MCALSFYYQLMVSHWYNLISQIVAATVRMKTGEYKGLDLYTQGDPAPSTLLDSEVDWAYSNYLLPHLGYFLGHFHIAENIIGASGTNE